MVCGMIHRSEMQVLSVKFWRCSPISVALTAALPPSAHRLPSAFRPCIL